MVRLTAASFLLGSNQRDSSLLLFYTWRIYHGLSVYEIRMFPSPRNQMRQSHDEGHSDTSYKKAIGKSIFYPPASLQALKSSSERQVAEMEGELLLSPA